MKNEHASEFVPQAVEYLTVEKKIERKGQYEKVLCAPIADKLIDFCNQDAEFAQAVAQKKNFDGCLAAVAKNAGKALSDVEAYGRAAAFYFSGAKVNCIMTIDLVGDAAEPCAEQNHKRLELSIFDIL